MNDIAVRSNNSSQCDIMDLIEQIGTGGIDHMDAKRKAIQILGELSLGNPSAIRTELLQAALSKAAIDNLAKEFNELAISNKVDWQAELCRWLSTYSSASTKRTYKLAIIKWQQWLAKQGVNPVQATPQHADLYAAHCRETRKPTSANLSISAVSSFYARLVKWELLSRNPFINIRYSRVSKKHKPLATPSISQSANPIVNAAIEFIKATGCRVGIFATLKIDANGNWSGISKGIEHNGVVDKSVAKRIRKHLLGLNALRSATLAEYIHRALGCGAHTLRHRFAINLYKSTGHNVEAVRRALGHSNIAITTAYLAGLEIYNA